jgi:hypothetical protein
LLRILKGYNNLNYEILNQNFKKLYNAIELCIKNRLEMPSLILIYTAIDIAGWLNSENPNEKVIDSFTNWVDLYMLPAKPLECTALDLYGARCGLLHNLSPDSNRSAKGRVRKIFYASKCVELSKLQEMIKLAKITNYVVIKSGDLVESYRLGLDAFMKELQADPTKAIKIYEKSEIMFMTCSDENVSDLLSWGKKQIGNRTE